jgi:hypothetical protein
MAPRGPFFVVKKKPKKNAAPEGVVGKLKGRVRLALRWGAFGLFVALFFALILWLMVWWYQPPPTKFNTVRVSGNVVLDGHPFTKGLVMFHANAKKGNTTQVIPSGHIDADGNYELRTGKSRGAPPGWYRVTVVPLPEAETREKGAAFKPPFNEKFTRDDHTPLHVEVKEGAKEGAYTLHLTK